MDSKVDIDDGGAKPSSPPPDFRCPISLDLELVSNKALKNLISRWCRENGVAMEGGEPGKPEPAPVVTANKAALEAARMTASFLVKKLSVSFSPDARCRSWARRRRAWTGWEARPRRTSRGRCWREEE